MKASWKQMINKAVAVVLVVCLGVGTAFVASIQDTVAPNNPITEPLVRQFLPMNLAQTLEVEEELLQEDAAISDASSEQAQETSDFGDIPSAEGKAEVGANTGNRAGTVGPEFFNVVIDETPTVPKWRDFYLVHYKSFSEYQPVEVAVSLNGGAPQKYLPEEDLGVQLDGSHKYNIVTVTVTYVTPDGVQVIPSPVVRVIPIITHELSFNPEPPEQVEIYKGTYSFALAAYYLDKVTGEEVYVTPRVFCGGTEYYRDSEGRYHINLSKGENVVRMTAGARNIASIEAQTIVNYVPLAVEINIDPEEFPSYVTDPRYPFRAWLTDADPEVRLQVFSDNVEIKTTGNDEYLIAFHPGFNPVVIRAVRGYGGDMVLVDEIRAVVEHRPDDNDGKFFVESNLPAASDIDGYTHVNQSSFFLSLTVRDESGNLVYASNIKVYINGVERFYRQEHFGTYEYELPLMVGRNELKMVFYNDQQSRAEQTIIIWRDDVSSGDTVIGQATIVLDASAIGLGTIASGAVDIIQGQPAAYQVESMLSQSGFNYDFRGSAATEYYLAHIVRPGITNGNAISEATIQELTDLGAWHGNFYQDSLGERDFTYGSGWWVFRGGEEPTMGLSHIRLNDGDVLTVQFRLN